MPCFDYLQYRAKFRCVASPPVLRKPPRSSIIDNRASAPAFSLAAFDFTLATPRYHGTMFRCKAML